MISLSKNSIILTLGILFLCSQQLCGQGEMVYDDAVKSDTLTGHHLALKSNVLFDLALAPNAELEMPLGRSQRWSVMGEWWGPWWLWRANSNSYEILTLGGELRYWLGDRRIHRSLTGWFFGGYGAWAKYDLEWKSVGDQGEVWSAGLSSGYCWRIARNWNMEVSVAAGYLWGRRHHYHGEFNDEHLIWKYDADMRYIGPTKLKLSLVWLLGKDGNKRKEAVHE